MYLSLCKVLVILVRFERKLNFAKAFSKNTHIKYHENTPSLSRIVPFGRTDGRTDRQTDRGTDM